MKNFLVLIFVLIVGAIGFLILTDKKVEDVVPDSMRNGLSGTSAIRAIRFPSARKTESSSETAREGTGSTKITAVDTTGAGSAARRKADAKARDLIAGARRFLNLGDPRNAKGEIEAIERLSCSTEIKREAETITEKILPLYEHLFAMKSEPIEGFRIYEMKGGGRVRGWVTNQTGDTVTLKLEGGGETVLQKSTIAHIAVVDPDKRCEELLNEYLKQKDLLPEGNALAHYDLAVFCQKKGMDDLAIKHLQIALEADENVYESVSDKGAKKLYLMVVWFGSMGEKERKNEYESKLKKRFPTSKYIAMLKEDAAGYTVQKRTAQPLTKKTPTPSSPAKKTSPPSYPTRRTSTSTSEWEAEGDKAYNIGIEYYRKSWPLMGTSKFNKENRLAMEFFEKAVKHYKKAKKEGKAGPRIDTKITDANSLKYGCFKMARAN